LRVILDRRRWRRLLGLVTGGYQQGDKYESQKPFACRGHRLLPFFNYSVLVIRGNPVRAATCSGENLIKCDEK
jgi:hypothetical protein